MNKKILAVLSVILLAVLACGTMPATQIPTEPTPSPSPSATPTSISTPSIKSTGVTQETVPPVEMYVTAAKALNVRKLPTEHSPSIGNLLAGERINLLADTTGKPFCDTGWLRIDFYGHEGWVNAEFISGVPCE
jgi:uncharacterized protein YgiM (DUF1202 family)